MHFRATDKRKEIILEEIGLKKFDKKYDFTEVGILKGEFN